MKQKQNTKISNKQIHQKLTIKIYNNNTKEKH